MNKLTRISATVASSVALVAGFAGVAGAAPMISRTGADSTNRVEHRNTSNTTVRNTSDVDVRNNNPQTARTGDVHATRNTTADNVSSGAANNDSLLDASVDVDNSSSAAAAVGGGSGSGSDFGDASIDLTGADSLNTVTETHSMDTRVVNDSNVRVVNNNNQNAVSGDVSADRNTTVGDVTSGDASNVSTTTLSVSVSN